VKRPLVAGAAALLALGVAIPAFATAQDQKAKGAKARGWVVCREHPVLHLNPPLTLASSHPFNESASDVLESCTSTDPTIDRGIAYITGKSSSASCASGTVQNGVARIRWNNGRTTRVNFTAAFGGGFARTTTGHIAPGTEFAGQPFAALDKLNVDQIAFQLCQSPMGLGTLSADGEISIGSPPVGGATWRP
jgi:hypothetical protein